MHLSESRSEEGSSLHRLDRKPQLQMQHVREMPEQPLGEVCALTAPLHSIIPVIPSARKTENVHELPGWSSIYEIASCIHACPDEWWEGETLSLWNQKSPLVVFSQRYRGSSVLSWMLTNFKHSLGTRQHLWMQHLCTANLKILQFWLNFSSLSIWRLGEIGEMGFPAQYYKDDTDSPGHVPLPHHLLPNISATEDFQFAKNSPRG